MTLDSLLVKGDDSDPFLSKAASYVEAVSITSNHCEGISHSQSNAWQFWVNSFLTITESQLPRWSLSACQNHLSNPTWIFFLYCCKTAYHAMCQHATRKYAVNSAQVVTRVWFTTLKMKTGVTHTVERCPSESLIYRMSSAFFVLCKLNDWSTQQWIKCWFVHQLCLPHCLSWDAHHIL